MNHYLKELELDKIECPHCQRQCTPKLWHYRPAFGTLRYMATQHLCPYCGGVMYQTGGQLSFLGWVVAIVVGGILAVGLVAQLAKSQDALEVIEWIGSIALWSFIGYKLYKRFGK